MHNGGTCDVCNVDGHIARCCPSGQGPDGKATGTDECCGCHGNGHRKDVCPTTNPQLRGGKDAKGGGKSWGKGKGSGGKGWGGKGKGSGGKGWGKVKGKGSGLYDLDLWQGGGGDSGSDWSGWGDSDDWSGMQRLGCLTVKIADTANVRPADGSSSLVCHMNPT